MDGGGADTLPCPICKKPVSFDDPNSPFCSERCRIMDLANWATEKYVIPTPVSEAEEEDDGGSE
jgi:uncharacterized protein